MDQPPARPLNALEVSALVRVALIVTNLDRSTAFYRTCLEHQDVYWEGVLAGESLERLLGVPEGAQCRARILSASRTHMGMVGLFELPHQPGVQKSNETCGPGEAILVFYASDLDVVTDRLRSGGHRILCPPIPLVHEGRIKQREMTCLDPDGFKINLIEWDPTANARPELSPGRLPD